MIRGDAKEPYRVRVRADNAKLQGIPMSPLGRSTPADLYFGVALMQEFAEKTWPGTVSDGICFESDR